MFGLFWGVCAIGICGFMGIVRGRALEQRVIELKQSLIMVEKLQTCLRYERMPTKELIGQLARLDGLESLRFIKECDEQMQKNGNFPKLWKESIENSRNRMDLNSADRELLKRIGDVVGGTDADGQISGLGLIGQMLSQALGQAEEERKQKGTLYRSLGVLCGIGIAILLV